MHPAERLPWPAGWPAPNKGRIVAGLVFVGCLGLLGVLVAFGFVAAGLAGGLRYSLVFAAMMFLTAAFGYVFQLGSRHRGGEHREPR